MKETQPRVVYNLFQELQELKKAKKQPRVVRNIVSEMLLWLLEKKKIPISFVVPFSPTSIM